MKRKEKIETLLRERLNPEYLEVSDDSHRHVGHAGAATGLGHFTVTLKSPTFENKSHLECHRMIYHVLDDLMKSDIHALKIKII